MVAADKQRLFILDAVQGAHLHIVLNRGNTGGIEIDDPFLVALAKYTHSVIVADICVVESRHLRNTQAAIEKERQNRIVTRLIFAFNRVQQFDTLFECEILWQRFFLFGRFQFIDRVDLEIVFLGRQVLEESLKARNLACACSRLIAAFTLQPRHVFISVRQRDGFQKMQIEIVNFDFIEFTIIRYQMTLELHKSEKRS